ncbi:FAD:protein FMN transferase [Maridesulfovibrio sp. FT414]|uniref:FAD:protein FMN transferase n=1 Tax=Maridesulfovibrio sp. FT414 TaxID=2979469 RepID=UPI003D80806D
MQPFTRRSFVKAISAMGSGAAFAATPVSATMRVADALRFGDRRFKLCETRFLMGTSVSITAIHESRDAVVEGIEAAFAEIGRLADIFDRRQPNAPVSVLNETGRLTDAPAELCELMKRSQAFYRRSDGAFDPTVLPVVEMIRSNAGNSGIVSLTRSDLDDALALVGADKLKVGDRDVQFDRSGMSVTFDGIGKGFIVDRASDILLKKGIGNHLINAGGDIRARGERAADQPWMVAIEEPGSKGCYTAVIRLKDAAVATSGGYEVYFDAENSRQAVNPQTALAPVSGVSVSVTAPTVMEADALSTSAFVMTPESAMRFINGQAGSECMLVSTGGQKMLSRCWETMVRV